MKHIFSYHSAIRALSIAVLVLSGVVHYFFGSASVPVARVVCTALLAAAGVLTFIPLSTDRPPFSLYFSLGYVSALGLCRILFADDLLLILVMCCATVVYTLVRTARKYSRVRLLFSNNAVKNEVEDRAGLLYVCLYQFVAVLSVLSMSREVLQWPVASVAAILYAVLYVKAYTGYTMMISPKRERKIDDMLKASLQGGFKTEDEHEIARMKALYERCEDLMSTKKPFLDPDFSLEDLALTMFTNKVFLSRTVNSFSGRNFRQYINYHRIQYALSLLSKDPKLKITELSVLAGFNTPVSFTMAFKLNVGQTPSDYRESLSSPLGEVL